MEFIDTYTIQSELDLTLLLQKAKDKSALGFERYNFALQGKIPPLLTMVYKGFLPYYNYENKIVSYGFTKISQKRLFDYALEYKIAGRSDQFISFLTNISQEADFNLDHWHYWLYGSINYFIERAMKGSSIGLQLFARSFLYSSLKLRIDMSIYKINTKKNYKFKNKIAITGYYSNDGNLNYYYEPESTTYLAYNTAKEYLNKLQAYQDLCQLTKQDVNYELLSIANTGADDKAIREFKEHGLIDGLYAKPLELVKRFPNKFSKPAQNLAQKLSNEKPIYLAEWLGLVCDFGQNTTEDILKEPIREMAKEVGFDLIVIQKNIGRYQINTEILDTRSKSQSLESLILPS